MFLSSKKQYKILFLIVQYGVGTSKFATNSLYSNPMKPKTWITNTEVNNRNLRKSNQLHVLPNAPRDIKTPSVNANAPKLVLCSELQNPI